MEMNNTSMNELSAAIIQEMPNLDARSFSIEVFDATKEQEGTVFADAVQAAVGMLSADAFAVILKDAKTAAAPYVSRYLFAAVKATASSADLGDLLTRFTESIEAAAELRGVALKDKWRTSSTLAGYLSLARSVFAAMHGEVKVELFDESFADVPAMPELIHETSLQKAGAKVKKAKDATRQEAEARLAQSSQQDTLHESAAATQGAIQAPPRLATDAAAATDAVTVVEYVRSEANLLADVRASVTQCLKHGVDLDSVFLLVAAMRTELEAEQAKLAGDELPDATPSEEAQQAQAG